MFKLWASLLVALLAGLTALVAGIISDARLEIALLRGLICFLGFGCLAYAGAFLFDKFELGRVILSLADEGKTAGKADGESEGDNTAHSEADESQAAAEMGNTDGSIAEEEAGGFVPLSSEDLRRVPI